MRVLLDNCVNQRFGKFLPNQQAVHVRQLGWADLTNGKLLAAAEEAEFDVLLTVDQNVRTQQSMSGRRISLITLDTRSITLEGISPFAVEVELAILKLAETGLLGQDILIR